MSPRSGHRRGHSASRREATPRGPGAAAPRGSPAPESRDPNLWLVGRIGRPVGLRGEFNLHPVSNDPEDLERVAEAPVRLAAPGADPAGAPPTRWENLRWQGGRAVAALAALESREQCAEHVHWQLWVDRRDLPALEEGRHWVDDLIGCTVIQVATADTERQEIGEVTQVVSGAAQDQLEVAMGDGRKAHIPFVEPFLVTVCTEARRIKVDLPAGLLDV